MLLKNPKQFAEVARKWAVQFAGAQDSGNTTPAGGQTSETHSQPDPAQAARNAAMAKLVAYVALKLELVGLERY